MPHVYTEHHKQVTHSTARSEVVETRRGGLGDCRWRLHCTHKQRGGGAVVADHKHERPVEDELQRGTGGTTKAGDHGRSSGGNRAELVHVHHNLVWGGTKVWDVCERVKVWSVCWGGGLAGGRSAMETNRLCRGLETCSK